MNLLSSWNLFRSVPQENILVEFTSTSKPQTLHVRDLLYFDSKVKDFCDDKSLSIRIYENLTQDLKQVCYFGKILHECVALRLQHMITQR